MQHDFKVPHRRFGDSVGAFVVTVEIYRVLRFCNAEAWRFLCVSERDALATSSPTNRSLRFVLVYLCSTDGFPELKVHFAFLCLVLYRVAYVV